MYTNLTAFLNLLINYIYNNTFFTDKEISNNSSAKHDQDNKERLHKSLCKESLSKEEKKGTILSWKI